MAIYDLTGLLTVTDCDVALKTVSKTIAKLQKKRDVLEHRLEVHEEMVFKVTEERRSLELDVLLLNSRLSRMEEGYRARECRYQIHRAECRIEFLDLRLEKYSQPMLLVKQFHLNQVRSALEDAVQFKAELEAHRTALLQEAAAQQPAIAAAPVTTMMPLTPVPQPTQRPDHLAQPKPVARFLHKRTGKRFPKTKQAMRRAG
ncbi:hypothetical protein [Niabella sp.]|uniref:hypothetical protein n=1 Tax=Niabella sp. TaxID=1962976 RepID=UPI002617D530|nr:hypothetical protein [Niabella sp.]